MAQHSPHYATIKVVVTYFHSFYEVGKPCLSFLTFKIRSTFVDDETHLWRIPFKYKILDNQ